MSLDPKDERALEGLVADLRGMHGDALLCVALTGEAAGPGYVPRRSPLNVVVVLEEVTPDALRRTRGRISAWQRRRIPTPLLMDPRYIENSLDVFPLEFLEIGDRHRVLEGRSDVFSDLEVEEQIRGKLLHLWEAYLEAAGSKRALRQLLLETPPGFEVILRGMLRLGQGAQEADDRSADPEALLREVEERFELELPAFRRLEGIRRGRAKLPGADLDGVFDAYLAEVRRLVRVADDL
jgi:hypothetical protein